jgi:hypothetical protein
VKTQPYPPSGGRSRDDDFAVMDRMQAAFDGIPSDFDVLGQNGAILIT